MQELIDSYKKGGHLHHAYFLVGNREVVGTKLKDFLEKNVGIKTSGNPDFWHGQYKTFTIENARQITDAQERAAFAKGFGEPRKIFIIQAEIITEEAQNALLKVFEEPTFGTHFFVISPQDILLPTLRSRMQVIPLEDRLQGEMSKTVFDILGMKMKERLAKVKEITDAIKDGDQSLQSYDEARKTKQDAIYLLNQIETELHSKGLEKSAKALEICELARESLYDRGAPVKMILENVMLSI